MPENPDIGREIGSYRLVEFLGEGGMARVFRAEHTAIGKEAALKILKREYSRRPEVVTRFFHEAKAVNRIRHENLIDIFDFGQSPEGEHYIVMELLKGEPLSAALEAGEPFPPERVGHIGLQLCSALSAAHEQGIVHRDLKGSNIFLVTKAGQRDFVKILDFGIAKILGQEDTPSPLQTQSGAMIGTPLTMSPEQARGEKVGPQTDIYALGVLLYHMATGEPPFYHDNAVLLALMHVSEPLPPPSQKYDKIPAALEAVIVRCLEKEKSARYQTMAEVAADLRRAVQLEPTSSPPPSPPSVKEKAFLPDSQRTIPPVPIDSHEHAPSARRRWGTLATGALALGLLSWGGVYLMSNSPTPSESAASPTLDLIPGEVSDAPPLLPLREELLSATQAPPPASASAPASLPAGEEEEPVVSADSAKKGRRSSKKGTGASLTPSEKNSGGDSAKAPQPPPIRENKTTDPKKWTEDPF